MGLEMDPDLIARAGEERWPAFVSLRRGEALELLKRVGEFDLVFADAPGGKTEGLERTIAVLRPGGLLVVDDMAERPDDPVHCALWPELARAREALLSHPALVCVELAWASGVIICARRWDA